MISGVLLVEKKGGGLGGGGGGCSRLLSNADLDTIKSYSKCTDIIMCIGCPN